MTTPRATEDARAKPTIAVLGAGHVGSAFAFALLRSGLAAEIVLVDADEARAEGEAMDIAQAVPFGPPVIVRAAAIADWPRADVTVLTAGVAQRPGEPRTALAKRNASVVADLAERAGRANPDGILVVATNPVDAMTWIALRASGLSRRAVIGSGTVLDSARLRSMVSAHFSIDARNVHAHVVGEHGDSEVALWSTASIGGAPLRSATLDLGVPCDDETLAAIAGDARDAAYAIIERKGATSYAIASALVQIVAAIVRNEKSVLTVSTRVDGAYGIRDVCLSLPTVVGASGAERMITPPLAEAEASALRASAQRIRATIDALP